MPLVKAEKFDVNYIESRSGFPIVLINGLAGDHTAWLPHLDILKDRHRVIVMDNLGSGDSSPVTSPCTTEYLADTIHLWKN